MFTEQNDVAPDIGEQPDRRIQISVNRMGHRRKDLGGESAILVASIFSRKVRIAADSVLPVDADISFERSPLRSVVQRNGRNQEK